MAPCKISYKFKYKVEIFNKLNTPLSHGIVSFGELTFYSKLNNMCEMWRGGASEVMGMS